MIKGLAAALASRLEQAKRTQDADYITSIVLMPKEDRLS